MITPDFSIQYIPDGKTVQARGRHGALRDGISASPTSGIRPLDCARQRAGAKSCAANSVSHRLTPSRKLEFATRTPYSLAGARKSRTRQRTVCLA